MYQMLIDGSLVVGAATLDVVNPATGQVFASAARADAWQLEQAVEAGNRAFSGWSKLGFSERRTLLIALADAVEARSEEFARLLTQEQGKPLPQAAYEVAGTIAVIRYFASQALEPRVLRDSAEESVVEHRVPLGVVAAITPWNYPLLLLMIKVAPALIVGNTVIAKPAPTTPLTTLLLGSVAAAILPAGVLQTIVDSNDLGPVLTRHPGIAHVSFTGSTATGKKVLGSTVDSLKRFTLELGGNDAALVLEDADIKAVAPKIFEAATMNSGQVCFAAKRIFAPSHMVGALCAELEKLAEAAIVGDGLELGTTLGPIQNRVQYDRVLEIIEDARANGTVVTGGHTREGEGFFISPMVVRDLPDNSRLVREEQFGPLLPVLSYESVDEALNRINGSEYGLGGTVWTSNPRRGIEIASQIQSGTVWVNKFLDIPFDIAFGGAKQSGIGRQQGIEGMEEFTQARIINAALAPAKI